MGDDADYYNDYSFEEYTREELSVSQIAEYWDYLDPLIDGVEDVMRSKDLDYSDPTFTKFVALDTITYLHQELTGHEIRVLTKKVMARFGFYYTNPPELYLEIQRKRREWEREVRESIESRRRRREQYR